MTKVGVVGTSWHVTALGPSATTGTCLGALTSMMPRSFTRPDAHCDTSVEPVINTTVVVLTWNAYDLDPPCF